MVSAVLLSEASDFSVEASVVVFFFLEVVSSVSATVVTVFFFFDEVVSSFSGTVVSSLSDTVVTSAFSFEATEVFLDFFLLVEVEPSSVSSGTLVSLP